MVGHEITTPTNEMYIPLRVVTKADSSPLHVSTTGSLLSVCGPAACPCATLEKGMKRQGMTINIQIDDSAETTPFTLDKTSFTLAGPTSPEAVLTVKGSDPFVVSKTSTVKQLQLSIDGAYSSDSAVFRVDAAKLTHTSCVFALPTKDAKPELGYSVWSPSAISTAPVGMVLLCLCLSAGVLGSL